MIPDSSERTVKIPVQWIDGQWQLVGGGKLPELVCNACADLVMPAIFLADEDQRARWSEEITVPFLQKGTELFARVSLNKVPVNLQDKTESKPYVSGVPSRFVKIVLDADLSLSLTLGKKGRLSECNCTIPALSAKAGSVNEAYKKIVTVFEPGRRSNAGNAFSLVWLEQDNRFVRLNNIREQITNAAASAAARPRERSETWEELAVTSSQVYELWTERLSDAQTDRDRQPDSNPQSAFPFPDTEGNTFQESGRAFFDYRQNLMLRNEEGLTSLFSRFNDPDEHSLDIQRLRELRAVLDRAVLETYGWHDLAQSAVCGFVPDCEHVEDANGVGELKKASFRFRWHSEFRDNVRSRLLEFKRKRNKLEHATNHTATANDKKHSF